MRLLVLDGSSLLKSLVARIVPDGVYVESAFTFDEAQRRIESDPPDAVIINVAPTDLPWSGIQTLCHGHDPPIPVLYESSVWDSPSEAGLEDLDGHCHFLKKPYSAEQLKQELQRLLLLADGDPLHLGDGLPDDTLH